MVFAGLMAGDALAIALPDGPDLLLSVLAASSVAACAPLNPALGEAEFEFQLAGLAPRALLAAPDSPACAAARRLGIPLLEPGRRLGPASSSRRYPGSELLFYTSATTGKPKLVALSEANQTARFEAKCEALGLTSEDRMLSLMPLFHVHGLEARSQLRAGGTVILVPGFDPRFFLGWIQEFRPTWYTASPTHHRAILALSPGKVCRRHGLRCLDTGGGPMPAELRAALESELGVPVIEGYGMTETGLLASTRLPPAVRKPDSVGVRVGNTEIACEEGEIIVRGSGVISEYVNDLCVSSEVFRGGWFHTGDLGRLDSDGYLHITGRIKDLINRGGEKIQPLEVECTLAAHPAVQECAAFPVPHPTLGEDVAAAVVLCAGSSASESELRRFVSARLAAFKVPRRILFLQEIAKSATGKPSRALLAKRHAATASTPQPPADALETRLVAIWSQILNRQDIGVDDDFFLLGGDSLMATNMLVEVEIELGCRIAAFSEPVTIEHLAELLRKQVRSSVRPLFAIPGIGQNVFNLHSLSLHLSPDQSLYVLRTPLVASIEEMARQLIVEMRTVYPGGPYDLVGNCFGGIVAFEIASQLQRQGATVGLLTMVDTPFPGFFLKHGSHLAHFVIQPDWLVQPASYIKRVLRRVRSYKHPESPPDTIAITNMRAVRTYVPGTYGGRIVHFVASHEGTKVLLRFWGLINTRREWRKVATGGLDLRPLAGDHVSILTEPVVGELAAQLRHLLAHAASQTVEVLAS
jgi:acyl-CoA synthetase (AMP-forming)/AMP-acid ligase II/thioesterase domain-containing protein/acyl carrier protein